MDVISPTYHILKIISFFTDFFSDFFFKAYLDFKLISIF